MPKVSIIVPVYNVEKYLEICMDSIINQTLTDIEIICIDDGSTDLSGKILDEYALKDKRVQVIHKENAGYGAAMNDGMKLATGEYIGIVESDDKVDYDMYTELYQTAKKFDLEFVKSDAFYWYEAIDYLKRVHISSLNTYYDRILGSQDRNIFFDFFMNIWTGIYKKEFLEQHHIVFSETPGASYQDNGFWMQTCMYAQRVMWMNRAFYYYRQDNPEASVKSTSKMMAMTREYEHIEKLLKQRRQEELLPYCYAMKMVRHKGTYFRLGDDKKIEYYEQIKRDYERYKAYLLYNKYIDNFCREFLNNPLEYTRKITYKKKQIKDIITNNGLIIYGAGKYGDIALRTLYNEGFYEQIKCFAVSDIPKINRIATKNIYQISDALFYFPNSVVLIAVVPASESYAKISDILDILKVDKRVNISDILDNFYVL